MGAISEPSYVEKLEAKIGVIGSKLAESRSVLKDMHVINAELRLENDKWQEADSAAVKDLLARIDALEDENSDLRERVAILEFSNDALAIALDVSKSIMHPDDYEKLYGILEERRDAMSERLSPEEEESEGGA